MGLNSTVLLEAALLGFPVVSFAESLGTGTGVFVDKRVHEQKSALRLENIQISSERAEALLAHLFDKQMNRADLTNPVAVMRSHFFAELRRSAEWQTRYHER
jgi:predicted glycosyltransferase